MRCKVRARYFYAISCYFGEESICIRVKELIIREIERCNFLIEPLVHLRLLNGFSHRFNQ